MVVFIGLWTKKYHRSVRNVAMVCVAAVALGSSTYAWFVSNNNVDAITTDISAQSNSAYLVIQEATADKTATDNTSESSATAAEAVTNQYAHKDTFYIGGYDGSFTNLKVEDVKVSAKDNAKADLKDCGVTVTFTATPSQPGNKTQA